MRVVTEHVESLGELTAKNFNPALDQHKHVASLCLPSVDPETARRRPSFVAAAPPEWAERLYEVYCDALTVPVGRGVFGARMEIELVADGPVTLILQHERGASSSTPG